MTRRPPPREGFALLGIGAVACFACCAEPLLAVLGGVTITGVVGTLFAGAAALVLTVAGLIGFALVHRKRRLAEPTLDPVPVELTARSM